MQEYKGGKRIRVYHGWRMGGTVRNELNEEALIEVTLNKELKKMRK